MINTLNLMYNRNDDTYVLITRQQDKTTDKHDGMLYLSRIDIKKINESKIYGEIHRLKIKEADLDSIAVRGYEPVDVDTLITLRENIKKFDPDIWLNIKDMKDYTTQSQNHSQ